LRASEKIRGKWKGTAEPKHENSVRMFPMNRHPIHIFAIAFFLLHPAASTLKISPEEMERNNQAFPRLAETLQTDERNEGGTGSKAIERKDRQEEKVYYSTTTKEEETERRQEEKEKLENSLDMLKKMIIVPKRAQ
jgi:hypothetical protein